MVSKSKLKPKKVVSKVKKVSKKKTKHNLVKKVIKNCKKKGINISASDVILFSDVEDDSFSNMEKDLKKKGLSLFDAIKFQDEAEDNGVPPSISKLFRDFSKEVYKSMLKCLKDYKHESIDITGSQYLHGALESLRQLKRLCSFVLHTIKMPYEVNIAGESLTTKDDVHLMAEMIARVEESIAGIISFIRYSVQNSKHYKNDEHLSNFLYLLNKYEQDALLDEVKNGNGA